MELEKEPGLTITPCQVRPEAAARSTSSRRTRTVYPSHRANYLSDPLDQEVAVAGLNWARKIMSQPAISKYLDAPGDPFGDTDEAMLGYAEVAGTTIYHPVGTARWATARRRWSIPQLRVHRRRGPARGRRLGDAAPRLGQHQRPHHHDRREGRRHDPRQVAGGGIEKLARNGRKKLDDAVCRSRVVLVVP